MLRKVLTLMLVCLLLTSFSSVLAQTTTREYKSQMRDLIGELKSARKACNKQVDDLRSAAIEKEESMGRGSENLGDRRDVMYGCLKEQAAVRADFKKQRDLIRGDMKNLKLSYAGIAGGTSLTAGSKHLSVKELKDQSVATTK
ncbi:MAG: hypothetical protein HQ579_02185 [Candidatus Omnitrophica bacterium]|nr:hypothetical protein [Candidatus Omnitrophota bacterium]